MTHFLEPVEFLKSVKRVVVKVGTSVLTDGTHVRVAEGAVRSIVSDIAALCREEKEVVVVTSGAIGVGMEILALKNRPKELSQLQAAAATGQGRLMQWYTAHFEKEGLHAAQILLTRDDLENRRRYLNAKATLRTLLKADVVPIINENDTVSVEEIRYGDNDILSAHVAALVDADLLVVLSDVDQFEGPAGRHTFVTEITPDLEKAAQGTTKAVSTGGMRTKLEAAKIVMASGIPMVLLNGRHPHVLLKTIVQKELSGTWFLPRKGEKLRGRQRWVALTGRPKGILLVDAGAREALVSRGRSLLASGLHGVEGNFRRGDLVSVVEMSQHQEFARGLVRYSHTELEKIRGLRSDAIASVLERKAEEVIHRNSLVIVKG